MGLYRFALALREAEKRASIFCHLAYQKMRGTEDAGNEGEPPSITNDL
jgi:hypothetical protein